MAKRILLVEDEADLRTLLADKLKGAGYEVHEASDGDEGLDLAEKIKPDLIVSDIVMPKKGGNEFLKDLRKTDFGKNIPFVVLTARAKMKDYFEVVDVDDFLEKPIKGDEFVMRIEEVLKGVPKEKRTKQPKKEIETDKVVDIKISQDTESVISARSIDKSELINIEGKNFQKKQAEKPKESKVAEKKKVLIVDDDDIVCKELQKELAKHNYITKAVATPGKCLNELNVFFPDLILSRFVLAEMNADQMANIIKEMSRFRDTPIIIYNAVGQKVYEDGNPESDVKSFAFNSEGYAVLKKVNELLTESR